MSLTQEAHTKAAQDSEWAEWIRQIADGDEGSLGALHDAAAGFVYSVAMRITRCRSAAEEVTGNVFYQVWRTARSFDAPRGSPRTWLFVICRAQSLSYLRNVDSNISYSDMDALMDSGNEQDNDPQSLLMAIQKDSCLYLALQALNPRHQELLALAFFRGHTYSEIAGLMNMPLGTVKTNIRRAIQMLRSNFQLMEMAGKREKRVEGKYERL